MARNVERKLIRAGVLKGGSGVRRQNYFSKRSWQSSRSVLSGSRNLGEGVNQGFQNVTPLGSNERGQEVRRGEKGPNKGVRDLSY